MGEVLVKVEGVSKKFCRNLKRSLWYGVTDLASEFFGSNGRHEALRRDEFWAVRDVDFELRRGECLGLIGQNGAGKSTLLKMLNGLIKPDKGKITIKGRIGALIELGAGFNPILTGRENIYVNGQILGLTKKEIDAKFDEIVDFAEVHEFIDSPLANYSSGMRVRLGFAVASQMQPDVLLIDEVLAVGDIGFVLKCFNKMDSLLPKTAMIFVSHNIPQVARMSTHLLFMHHGQCVFNSSKVSEGITKYYQSFQNKSANFIGDSQVEIKQIFLMSNGRASVKDQTFTVNYGEDLSVVVVLSCKAAIFNPYLWLSFHDKEQRAFAEARNFNHSLGDAVFEGEVTIRAKISSIHFAQGNYAITVGLWEEKGGVRRTLFRFQSAVYFNVHGKQQGWAPIQLDPTWEVAIAK